MTYDFEAGFKKQAVIENKPMPVCNPCLWSMFTSYLNSRELSSTLACHNGWYPTASANDAVPRVLIPAVNTTKHNYWQARAMISEEPRYQSPSVARGDSIIVVRHWRARTFGLVCEGPMDALAGAMEGGLGIALMGNKPPEEALDLARIILSETRGPILIMADNDDLSASAALVPQFSLNHPCVLICPPPGYKDLASCSINQRKELLKRRV